VVWEGSRARTPHPFLVNFASSRMTSRTSSASTLAVDDRACVEAPNRCNIRCVSATCRNDGRANVRWMPGWLIYVSLALLGCAGTDGESGPRATVNPLEAALTLHLSARDTVLATKPEERDLSDLALTVTAAQMDAIRSWLSESWGDRYNVSNRASVIARFAVVSQDDASAVVRACEIEFIRDVPATGNDDGEGLIGAGLPAGWERTLVRIDGRWLLDRVVSDRSICDGVGVTPHDERPVDA